ncbi:hypothetical protein N656DRAFT_781152 [Canariomyces notabilis]|uniref:Uncharacterized protein n=1 Tax=Canariomyces notabilis TaxID=2074819 RepID=A0AAN6QIJ0_9PEZI|nr:hypothetical protein N656DRAFT_781152 [Canariomyces arenarius]
MADENAKLTDCYYEKKDWRACKDEVCRPQDLWFRRTSQAHSKANRWKDSGSAGN